MRNGALTFQAYTNIASNKDAIWVTLKTTDFILHSTALPLHFLRGYYTIRYWRLLDETLSRRFIIWHIPCNISKTITIKCYDHWVHWRVHKYTVLAKKHYRHDKFQIVLCVCLMLFFKTCLKRLILVLYKLACTIKW